MTEILTRQEVGKLFKMPVRTVDYLVSTGQIPFSRVGKKMVRFDKDRLTEWFREREHLEYRHQKPAKCK